MTNRDFFYFAGCVPKLLYYSDVIFSFDWKSAIEHDGGLKCVIVYLARVIPAFVMYCVNGVSCSSLLIDSTDSIGLFTSISLQCALKRIKIECAFNPLWNISHYKDAMHIEQ